MPHLNSRRQTLLAASLLVGLSVVGSAQEPPARPDPEQVFRRADADRDGKLSREEFARLARFAPRFRGDPEQASAAFRCLDRNADGALSLEEFRAGRAGGDRPRPAGEPVDAPGPVDRPASLPELEFFEKKIRPVVEVGAGGWDQHRNLKADHERNAGAVDRPIAGLLTDVKQRGLLKDTLVVWAGEFGRTPFAQNNDGRDHNNKGFTLWMAGGGVKGGLSYGSNDDYGAEAVENKVHIHDLHATLLHLIGLDYERLTYRYAGRDFRLTDVHGQVVQGILS